MANQKYDAFLTVARLGSFKAAAEELGYTQAGISYLVNALEKELGLTLFLREYGGVHLTTEGREVLGLVQAINADEHALATRVRELADREGWPCARGRLHERGHRMVPLHRAGLPRPVSENRPEASVHRRRGGARERRVGGPRRLRLLHRAPSGATWRRCRCTPTRCLWCCRQTIPSRAPPSSPPKP